RCGTGMRRGKAEAQSRPHGRDPVHAVVLPGSELRVTGLDELGGFGFRRPENTEPPYRPFDVPAAHRMRLPVSEEPGDDTVARMGDELLGFLAEGDAGNGLPGRPCELERGEAAVPHGKDGEIPHLADEV